MRKFPAVFLTAPILATLTGPAFAHAHLASATPPVDGTITEAPKEIGITFTEAVEPRFSTIEVTGPDAKRVDDAQPHLAGNDPARLAVGVRSLPPGTYTVAWHATSVDTHKTDGRYRFTIAATDTPGISLEHVWARPTAGAGGTGAVWFTISNSGPADRLTGASTPVAASAEVHETIDDKGVMKMRPVPSIALDSGKPVTFKPGGYHVMLMGLKDALKPGSSFPLTLTFEHAQPLTVTVKVEAGAAGAMDHGHGGMGGMQGMPGMHGQ